MLKLVPVLLLVFFSFSASAQINMVVKKSGFLFMEGKDSVFFYQKLPKDLNGKYSRCNYIHPLYGLDNSRLTEDFPADHLHHRGVFWAWHQIFIDGKQVSDGWLLNNFEQKVTDFEFRLHNGMGVVNTVVVWKSPLWKEGEDAYLKEETQIIIHPAAKNYRRLDFTIKLKALTDRLSIGGSNDIKGYGGFSVRLKLPEGVTFTGENGLVEPQNTAVEAGHTMKISGSFLKNGKKGGVVIYSDKDNPSPATSWILRKSGSMQNVAFPGRNRISIPFDKPLILKYSLLVFEGDLSSRQVRRLTK